MHYNSDIRYLNNDMHLTYEESYMTYAVMKLAICRT